MGGAEGRGQRGRGLRGRGLWLTNGKAAVGATEVDVALGDGGHAQLVVGAAEEGGQGAGEHDVPLARGATRGNADLEGRRRGGTHTR